MTTLSKLLSSLKQNPDLLPHLTQFVHQFSMLRQHVEPHTQPFARAESTLLEHTRVFSSQLQSLLLSAWDQPAPRTLAHQGSCFERTRQLSKTYQGLDGTFTLKRWIYHCPESGTTLCPLELRAGLVQGKLTPAAARLELMSAASEDYRKAVSLHQAAFVLGRSKSSLERDVIAMGEHLEARKSELEKARREKLEPVKGLASISVSVDRTGLPFEQPVPRKPGRPKKGAAKKPCEVVKRQVYCASITAHDAKGQALMTQRFAGLPHQGDEVVTDARACLEKMLSWAPDAKLVQICDGAPEMQRRGREILEGHHVAHELVDAWHAASYVSQAFSAAGHPEAYGKEMVRRLVENKTGVEENLLRLRTIALSRRLKEVEDGIRYLSNHKELMGYWQARSEGLPIGSGSVEATCKSVVAVRFKRSGARWKAKGAEPLLKVRAWLNSDQEVWRSVCNTFLDSYTIKLAS